MKILSQILYEHDVSPGVKPYATIDVVSEYCLAFVAEDSPKPSSANDVVDGYLKLIISCGFKNEQGHKRNRRWLYYPEGHETSWSYSGGELYDSAKKAWENIMLHALEIQKEYPVFKPDELFKVSGQVLWYLFQDIFGRQ